MQVRLGEHTSISSVSVVLGHHAPHVLGLFTPLISADGGGEFVIRGTNLCPSGTGSRFFVGPSVDWTDMAVSGVPYLFGLYTGTF